MRNPLQAQEETTMRRSLLLAVAPVLLATFGSLVTAQTIFVSPDVPTTPDGPATYLPSEVVRHVPGPGPYSLELSLPGDPAIDAMHKMDLPGSWLFSIEAANDFAGGLPAPAEPRDVVRYDAGLLSQFFDGSCVAPMPVPDGSSIDALYLDGGDGGDLIVSFDVPTTIGSTFLPSDLVRYRRVGIARCGWLLVGPEVSFNFGTYFPSSANVTGADFVAGDWIVSLDIPTDVGPPGVSTATPGQIVSTDGANWALLQDLQASGLPGWAISSQVDALTCEANPGRIDTTVQQITMDKNLPSISIICPAGCSSGGAGYGLYEGTIANINLGIYDHQQVGCSNVCPGNIVHVPPGGTSTYYLVVPNNTKEEGSYCTDSDGNERPQPAALIDRCAGPQNLTPCP